MAITLSSTINTTDYRQPPFTSGIMAMEESDKVTLLAEINRIISEFEPDYDNWVFECDNQYIATTFKNENTGYFINGDTIDYLRFSYVPESDTATTEGEV